jgi:cysteinyl-tRNA synthetase
MSHLGHARTYLTFDIIRRILEDYFHVDVNYIVNVTDIDDKIIKKANFQLLTDLITYIKETKEKKIPESVLNSEALQIAIKDYEQEKSAKSKEQQVLIVKIYSDIKKLQELLISEKVFKDLNELKSKSFDFPDINKVSRKFEKLFWEDMDVLNVKKPTVITRVTEYVPQIIKFVEKIVENGFGYAVNGSVYFDTQAFQNKGHIYAKLVPTAIGNDELFLEG